MSKGELPIGSPQWISSNIGNDDGCLTICCGAARAHVGTDGYAFNRPAVFDRDAVAGAESQSFSILIEQKYCAKGLRQTLFDECDDLFKHVSQRITFRNA